MKKNAYWKITSAGAREAMDTAGVAEKNFDVNAQMEGEKLFLSLFGRVDSLTAPKLLSFYENTANEKKVKAVSIDCAGLQYISSAGLRVLLIMKKNSEDGVFLENVGPQIMEILETTGFDSFFFGESGR